MGRFLGVGSRWDCGYKVMGIGRTDRGGGKSPQHKFKVSAGMVWGRVSPGRQWHPLTVDWWIPCKCCRRLWGLFSLVDSGGRRTVHNATRAGHIIQLTRSKVVLSTN